MRRCFFRRVGVFGVSAFDPRMYAAIKAISHIGGQHGQESKEGEEGEERSEEDCEEDPQGRQEEVISL